MIKIFSIKEIIDASEKILSINKKDKVPNLELKKKQDKKELKKKQNILDKAELLIINKEVKSKNIKTDNLKKIEQNNSTIHENKTTDNQNIIDELFKLFNKKIKKNTLKIIIDQQVEIKKLKIYLSELRKNDYRNLIINKELKNKIVDLANNEKILNFKISQIQEKLDITLIDNEELRGENKKLKIDHLEMKKSLILINETNEALEKSNLKFKDKIDNLVIANGKLDNSNKTNENNILILTDTKNHLFDEIKNLKHELKLISENKKVLIFNNEELQKEISLLSKNKELLIEINDKYQNQVVEHELEQSNFKEEKIFLDENIKHQ